MTRWWTSEQRWWYIERPFPWPLIAVAVLLVATVAWALL